MKKRGFTLIELLAVIVVLAIIALIATPIVMNVIKNAQKGAAERSAERYLDAVETAIATDRLENSLIADGTYTIKEDGNLYSGDTKVLTVEVSGDKPKAGSTIGIKNGQVVKSGTSMVIGDYTVTFNSEGKLVATETVNNYICKAAKTSKNVKKELAENTTDVYVDVPIGRLATKTTMYEYGTEYTCDLGDGERTFYVLEDGDNTTLTKGTTGTAGSGEVALILEKIYEGKGYYWCNPNGENPTNNVCDADGLTGKLDDIAENSWTKLDRSQIGLPSAIQIAQTEGISEPGPYTLLKHNHLYNEDDYQIDIIGSVYGYWTSTPNTEDSIYAWGVCWGSLISGTWDYEVYANILGLRPVITISKNNISF